MELNLEKVLEKGSLRWIGNEFNSPPPQKTIIAGNSIDSICNALAFNPYRFRRYSPYNVFVANSENIFYVFVKPQYSLYRKVFDAIIGGIPKGYHVDHVLAKNLAIHFKYNYVALSIIPDRVNIKHGLWEKQKRDIPLGFLAPEVCYSDDRIFNKILSRNPLARMKKESIEMYIPDVEPTYGLTLKQKGLWNAAFGLERIDNDKLMGELSIIPLNAI